MTTKLNRPWADSVKRVYRRLKFFTFGHHIGHTFIQKALLRPGQVNSNDFSMAALLRTHLEIWCDKGMTLFCQLRTINVNITFCTKKYLYIYIYVLTSLIWFALIVSARRSISFETFSFKWKEWSIKWKLLSVMWTVKGKCKKFSV